MKSRILSLFGDTLIYGIFIIVGRFLTFLLTPFYTNFLTVEEVGDVGNFFALIAFVNVIYSFGMDAAFFRFYNKDNEALGKMAFTYSYLTIGLIAFLISLILFITAEEYSYLLTNLSDKNFIVRLAVLVPMTDCLMVVPYAYLRMTRKVGIFSLIRFSLIVIAVSLNIYFVVFQRTGIKGVFYAQLIANIVGVLIFIPTIKRLTLFQWNPKLFRDMIKFGLPTVPATFSGIILQVVDRPILKFLTNASQVGIYMVNYRLAIPMMLFVAMYDYAWRPFYLTHYESHDAKELFARIFKYFVYFSGFIFLLNAFFIEFIIRLPFFGGRFIAPTYWEGLDIVPIVMLGYIFNGFYINFSAGINIQKRTKYLPISVGLAAVANIALNFILIPIVGYRGSAWATLFAYLSSAAIIYYFSQKVYPVKYPWERIIPLLFLFLIIYLVTNAFTQGFEPLVKFMIRLCAVFLYIALPFILNIFTAKEIQSLRSIIKSFWINNRSE